MWHWNVSKGLFERVVLRVSLSEVKGTLWKRLLEQLFQRVFSFWKRLWNVWHWNVSKGLFQKDSFCSCGAETCQRFSRAPHVSENMFPCIFQKVSLWKSLFDTNWNVSTRLFERNPFFSHAALKRDKRSLLRHMFQCQRVSLYKYIYICIYVYIFMYAFNCKESLMRHMFQCQRVSLYKYIYICTYIYIFMYAFICKESLMRHMFQCRMFQSLFQKESLRVSVKQSLWHALKRVRETLSKRLFFLIRRWNVSKGHSCGTRFSAACFRTSFKKSLFERVSKSLSCGTKETLWPCRYFSISERPFDTFSWLYNSNAKRVSHVAHKRPVDPADISRFLYLFTSFTHAALKRGRSHPGRCEQQIEKSRNIWKFPRRVSEACEQLALWLLHIRIG